MAIFKVLLILIPMFSQMAWSIPHTLKVEELDAKTRNGEVLVFKGGDAFKLLEMLPSDSYYSGSKKLTITSEDRSFTLSCMAKSKQVDEAEYKIDPASTECRISVDKSVKIDLEDSLLSL